MEKCATLTLSRKNKEKGTKKMIYEDVSQIKFQGSRNGNQVNVPAGWKVEVLELEVTQSNIVLWIAPTMAFTEATIDAENQIITVAYAGEHEAKLINDRTEIRCAICRSGSGGTCTGDQHDWTPVEVVMGSGEIVGRDDELPYDTKIVFGNG